MTDIVNNSYLLVDMAQLARNVETILKDLGPVKLIPVLKDDAYGMGLRQVGALLSGRPEIGTLAVSHVSEGLALRRAGIEKDVLVIGGVPAHLLPAAVEGELTLAVSRPGMLSELAALAGTRGRPVKVQIKVETGLHRIGLLPGEELAGLLEEWRRAAPHIEVTGAFTHFANLKDAARTEGQYRLFLEGTAQLEAGGMAVPLRHITASASDELLPQYRLDGARIGRELYMDNPIRPRGTIGEVCSWRTWITNLRQLKRGDALGYGGKVTLDRDALVATIGVGYGDGLSQELVAVNGPVLVRGRRARLLACCMDQAMVDVTGLGCELDDEVTLFGGDGAGHWLPSQEVALLIGEDEGCGLTARLSARVARVYRE